MRLFLSYASEDRAIAERLAAVLRDQGHRVFFDRERLQSGEGFDRRIQREIAVSSAFIFLISPNSIRPGRYSLTELDFARKRSPNPSRRILPALVAPTPMADIPGAS